jgi:hypothetical protein
MSLKFCNWYEIASTMDLDQSKLIPSSPRLPVCGSVQSDLLVGLDWTEPYAGPGSTGLVESLPAMITA